MSDEIGELIPKDSMILRQAVGEASASDGKKYEMTLSMAMAPLVKSELTGKTFSLPWKDILTLAIRAGVDGE
jgi:hypothetical protein